MQLHLFTTCHCRCLSCSDNFFSRRQNSIFMTRAASKQRPSCRINQPKSVVDKCQGVIWITCLTEREKRGCHVPTSTAETGAITLPLKTVTKYCKLMIARNRLYNSLPMNNKPLFLKLTIFNSACQL